MKRIASRLAIGATLVYCAGMCLLALLWASRTYPTWWLEFLNIFALYLFAPLLLLIPAALLMRSRWLRGGVLALTVVFLASFGARFIPPLAGPPTGAHLRVATFNHLHRNENVAGIIAAIRAQDADLVALQELSAPVAQAAGQELGDEYPYQFLEVGDSDRGMGILSRYPLRDTAMTEGFVGQQVTLDLGGEHVTLINVHLTAPALKTRRFKFRPLRQAPVREILDYDTSKRSHELPHLLATIDRSTGPLILLGDFNTGDREMPYADLAARMQDAFRESNWGFGFTFPTRRQVGPVTLAFPVVRLDYVWTRGGIVPGAARVDCAASGSDHCLLAADLYLSTTDDRRPTTDDRRLIAENQPPWLENQGLKIEDNTVDISEMRSSILHPPSSDRDGGQWSVVGGR